MQGRRPPRAIAALLASALIVELTTCGGDNAGIVEPDARPFEGGITAVLVGAGDIAVCNSPADEATAALLDTIPGTVFTLGDNAYPDGSAADYRCYDESWARHKARTRPSVGNHDYHTPGAEPYFAYFGPAAGEPGKGYYSYDVGSWHIVVLNTELPLDGTSPQFAWLEQDLATNPAGCILAYWHQPRFSSKFQGEGLREVWRVLDEAGAALVLAGHAHNYERFAPQDHVGKTSDEGVRQFVVGTGGAPLHAITTRAANSEVVIDDAHGVLRIELGQDHYRWTFISTDGRALDRGSARCR